MLGEGGKLRVIIMTIDTKVIQDLKPVFCYESIFSIKYSVEAEKYLLVKKKKFPSLR